MEAHDGECEYWRIMTINGFIPRMVGFYAAAISIIILALTSEWTQWFLATPPIQFLGKISFSLYIFHELFTEWCQVDTYYYFLRNDVEPNLALFYIWLIYTPLLILISWILTILVDDPSKDFAYDLDI